MKYVIKSIGKLLSSAKAEESAGEKITDMGSGRKFIVREKVAQGIKSGKSVGSIAKELKRSASSHKDKHRDWHRVARTEVTDSAGRASLELLKDLYGPEAKVYRDTSDCCEECRAAFGKPSSPKLWKIDDIPDNLAGAVHPSCKCSPWKTRSEPNLFKAMSYPVGMIQRSMEGGSPVYSISTGTGKWVSLFSFTGKYIIRHVMSRIPLVIERYEDGYVVYRVGHGRPMLKTLTLVDPRYVGGLEFYQLDPFNAEKFKENRMIAKKTLDDYLDLVTKVTPAVVSMPEYWDQPNGLKHLSDFMGYRTLTDWYVLGSPSIPMEAVLLKIRTGIHSVRSLVRRYAKLLVGKDDLKKYE